MGKIPQVKRRKNYYRVYEQIYKNSTISTYDLVQNTGLARNTVAKYLQEMYSQEILIGPYVKMNPAPNYREHVYLMNFENPLSVFQGLKGFPHVLHCRVSFGDWNIMITTDRNLDFSKLVGFQSMVSQGVKGFAYTPKVEYTTWDESFKKVNEKIKEFSSVQREPRDRTLTYLDWGTDEWKLYHAFKSNLRQKITPTLRRIKVRYEDYSKWRKTLDTHCTIHTEFYPEGYKPYMGYCFLLSCIDKSVVQSLFSFFPTSSVITEVGDHLLVFTQVPFSDKTRKLFCATYDMKTVRMIRKFSQAVILPCHDCVKEIEG